MSEREVAEVAEVAEAGKNDKSDVEDENDFYDAVEDVVDSGVKSLKIEEATVTKEAPETKAAESSSDDEECHDCCGRPLTEPVNDTEKLKDPYEKVYLEKDDDEEGDQDAQEATSQKKVSLIGLISRLLDPALKVQFIFLLFPVCSIARDSKPGA